MSQVRSRALILFGLLLMSIHAIAQNTCSAMVESAITSTAEQCLSMSRNQVCYGNVNVSVTPRPEAPAFTFERTGHITDVTYLRSLKLAPLNEAQGLWGMAMMQLQADIPDSLPGQNVTFVLFGDVEIENATSSDQPPMQAFYLRTAVGDAACVEAPDSGVLIQTPKGVESVHFNVNGVDVEIGSTVMLQATPAQHFTIRALEGAAVVTIVEHAYPVIAGTEMSIPIDDQMQPSGLPALPVPLAEPGLQALPITLLPEDIPPAAPRSAESMTGLQARLQAGLEPCGLEGLPLCEHALRPQADRIWAMQDQYAAQVNSDSDTIMVIEGPVSKITNNIISIYDFEITVEPQHPILNLLHVGDIIHVEGKPGSEGSVTATIVSNLSNPSSVQGATVGLEGPVESIYGSVITVNGIQVQLDVNDPLLQTVRVGQFVQLQGNFQGSGANIVLGAVTITTSAINPTANNACRYHDDGMGMGHWHCDEPAMGMGTPSEPGVGSPAMGMGDDGMGMGNPGMGMGMGG